MTKEEKDNSKSTPIGPHKQIEQVIEAYYKPLYRFAYSLSKSSHEACDLTQQTFLIYSKKDTRLKIVQKSNPGYSPRCIESF